MSKSFFETGKEKIRDIDHYKSTIRAINIDPMNKDLIISAWYEYLIMMNRFASRNFYMYAVFTVITLIAGAITPVIIKLDIDYQNIAIITSLISTISVSFLTTFKAENKWKHYRLFAEQIRWEGFEYFGLSGRYKKHDHKSGFPIFIERIKSINLKDLDSYFTKIQSNQEINKIINNLDSLSPENSQNSNTPGE